MQLTISFRKLALVWASKSSQANSTGSQAVYNSSQVDSTTFQHGMNAGSTGAQSQADNTFSQAGSTSSQPGMDTGNAGTQSQAGSAFPQASRLVLPRKAPLRSPRHSPPKRGEYTGKPQT